MAALAEPDPTRRAATAGFHHEIAAPQRRDCILYTGLDVDVLDHEVGDGLSDHRLVWARLQVTSCAGAASG